MGTSSESVLFFLLLPSLHGRLHPSRGELLMTRRERWLLCGTVALNPRDLEWSCCRDFYPFHRPTQRCCQAWDKFIVIPMDPQKSEAEDCRTYTQETLGMSDSTSRQEWVCGRSGEAYLVVGCPGQVEITRWPPSSSHVTCCPFKGLLGIVQGQGKTHL